MPLYLQKDIIKKQGKNNTGSSSQFMEQLKNVNIFHREMKQLEQILNAKNSKAETRQHRGNGERGATRAEGTRAGKIKTPQTRRHNRVP